MVRTTWPTCRVYLPAASVTVTVPASERLTNANASRLRDPDAWTIEELEPGVWNATLHAPLAVMQIRRTLKPCEAHVLSNTGGRYVVNVRRETCACIWHQRHAPACCKHLAAAIGVARWLRARRQARRATLCLSPAHHAAQKAA